MRQILNWLRRGKLESGLDRELEYHIDRRVSDLVRSGLPEAGSAEASHARTRRPHAGPGGSARRLAKPLAAGFCV